MLWLNFLHLYQPANIDSFLIKEALDKSYLRILRLLENNPDFHLTINISGCLIERLAEMGELDFLARLKNVHDKGQLEIVGTAAYHVLMPLVSEEEMLRQIKENEEILKKYFGANFKPRGFFFPEMAYSANAARVVKQAGYEWIILDEFSALNEEDFNKKKPFIDRLSSLKVVFRDRDQSRAYPPDLILKYIDENKETNSHLLETLITATDGELYGLRHEDPSGEMEKLAASKDLSTKTLSEFIGSFSENDFEEIDLRPSSWESSEEDLADGQPFRLWFDRKNKIHRDLWRLANLSLSLDEKFKDDINYSWYRWHLVRGLASCTFWWASANDFSENFGPYAWNPDIVDKGLGDLVRSVRSISDSKSRSLKLAAEKYYLKISKNLWREHWENHWPGKQK